MPRAERICFPGALYHIIQRGNNKRPIFFDDIDRWHFLKLFLEAKKQFHYLLFCYVLMKNHFHLTVETPNSIPISKIMQVIEGSYAMYFNKRHHLKGHLFQGRFKGIIVEKDAYLLELSRYVHLNPVRAKIVSLPEYYQWSSYTIYTGLRSKDKLVDTNTILNYFIKKRKKDSQNDYSSFVEEGISTMHIKEDWLEENLRHNRFLASKSFIKKLKKEV